jgi:flagellar basal body-associated protein FliL
MRGQPSESEVQMKRVTRSIVSSILAGAVIIALPAIGIGVWFFVSHHESNLVSKQSAEAEFSQLRSRFSTQPPLVDMSIRQPVDTSTIEKSVTPLHTFHTVIFDTRGSQRMVHIIVPYWFARLFAGHDGEFKWLGQLTFLDDTEFDSEAIHLSLDELEKRGPGLIIDYQHLSGGQFISWVE